MRVGKIISSSWSRLQSSMETCAALPVSHLSLAPPKSHQTLGIFPCRPSKPRGSASTSTRLHCQKMYVPGFSEGSPERKAANYLHDFFNYVAVRIVAAQLQSYNPEAFKELMEFLEGHSLSDGDKFCADMMRESSRHKSLALRILEVRSAYCKSDFEWDNLKRLACKVVDESNTGLMREYVLETSSVAGQKEKETGK